MGRDGRRGGTIPISPFIDLFTDAGLAQAVRADYAKNGAEGHVAWIRREGGGLLSGKEQL